MRVHPLFDEYIRTIRNGTMPEQTDAWLLWDAAGKPIREKDFREKDSFSSGWRLANDLLNEGAERIRLLRKP